MLSGSGIASNWVTKSLSDCFLMLVRTILMTAHIYNIAQDCNILMTAHIYNIAQDCNCNTINLTKLYFNN